MSRFRFLAVGALLLGLGRPIFAHEARPQTPPAGQRLLAFYAGTLPCADCSGIRTELSLFTAGADQPGGGSYWLKETYLGKPEGRNTFESGGGWTIQPGSPDDPGATVYRLREARSGEARFFLKVSEDELRMLDRSARPIDSKLGYTLKRRPLDAR